MSETHTNIRVHLRQPQTDRPRRRSSLFGAAACVLVAALALTGCGDDKPKPIPKTPTPSVSVSPAPSPEPLSSSQEEDYRAAVDKFDEFQTFLDEAGADPTVNKKVIKKRAIELVKIATKQAIKQLDEDYNELVTNRAHIEGHREVAWTSPVSVTNDKVVFLRCETPGTWTLVGKGKRVKENSNTRWKNTVITYKGRWFVDEHKVSGKC